MSLGREHIEGVGRVANDRGAHGAGLGKDRAKRDEDTSLATLPVSPWCPRKLVRGLILKNEEFLRLAPMAIGQTRRPVLNKRPWDGRRPRLGVHACAHADRHTRTQGVKGGQWSLAK